MRILGLDIGTRRIGIAVSDELELTAQGVETLKVESHEKAISRIADIVSRDRVREIVVGLPLNMDGSWGAMARGAAGFAEKLRGIFKIDVQLWDERLSSTAVERMLISANTSRAKRRQKMDKLAAQVILQGYLDAKKLRDRG